MTGIYHPCSRFTSQFAHFCNIFSKCKFAQIQFIVQSRISYNLGPGSAVGEKGKKRGQIGKIWASEASQVVSWGGRKGGGARRQPLMPPFHDTRSRYHALIGPKKCLHVDRFAVLLTVSCSFNITLIQFGERFFKTRISSTQYKFLCETFRLSHGSKKRKNMAVIKEAWSFSYNPLWQSTVTFRKRLTYKPTFKSYSIYKSSFCVPKTSLRSLYNSLSLPFQCGDRHISLI